MKQIRTITTAAGAALLLFALVGCTTAAQPHAAAARVASPAPRATPAVPKPAPTRVATPTPSPTPTVDVQAVAACAGTPAGVKHLYISISQQHLWACNGEVPFAQSAITTGASAVTNIDYATPLGDWSIRDKARDVVLRGSDVNGPWDDPVQYWMPFDGGIGLHDASWQTFPLGSPLYTTQGSHGCVHVSLDAIATIYDWAVVGTPLTVRA